jgi:hypothetical protein
MPKVTIEFDLNDPEDILKYKRYFHAEGAIYALWEIQVNGFRRWKHSEQQPTMDDMNQNINDIIDAHGLQNLDDLI